MQILYNLSKCPIISLSLSGATVAMSAQTTLTSLAATVRENSPKKCLANAHDVIWWLAQVAEAMSGGAARGPACLPASDVMASSSVETSRTS